jgi:hypothetical protein
MVGLLLLYVLMGSFAGYTSARLYKTFKGGMRTVSFDVSILVRSYRLFIDTWHPDSHLLVVYRQTLAELHIVHCSGVPWHLLHCVLHARLDGRQLPFLWSSANHVDAVSVGLSSLDPPNVTFATYSAVLALWFGISLPLVFLGAYFGYRAESLEFPVVTSNIPRQIPTQVHEMLLLDTQFLMRVSGLQPWYLNEMVTCMVGGILPFGCCFVGTALLIHAIHNISCHSFLGVANV